ncbi:MAG: prepilin-type N-terminal cleavage/methylation domain-containing protein [Elusimicrobiaceae bacterium]|nr:prepilin-type N-terminal cleavage/methylation domain-containing protein [Elusimicrobiaceae bacterium]
MRCIKGFTLIELLVVVLIVGVLAAVAVPQYKKAVLKSQWTEMLQIERAVSRAQELYYLGNDRYASNWDELGVMEYPREGQYKRIHSEFTGGFHVEKGTPYFEIARREGVGDYKDISLLTFYHSGPPRRVVRQCRKLTGSGKKPYENWQSLCKDLLGPNATVGNTQVQIIEYK